MVAQNPAEGHPRLLATDVQKALYVGARWCRRDAHQDLSTRLHDSPETLLKRLMEEHNFTFVEDRLPTLAGFLLYRDERRVISVAYDLEQARRLFLYLHMLGHIVLDDRRLTGPTVRLEPRSRKVLSVPELFEERRVDYWVRRLLVRILPRWFFLPGVSRARLDRPFGSALWEALRQHRLDRGRRAGLYAEATSTLLYSNCDPFRNLRNRPTVHEARLLLDRFVPV